MKSTELRIGNLVYDTKSEVNTVCVETFVKFNYQITPITLTDEWFEKFERFYKDGEYWSISINDYKYCFKYRDWAKNWAFYQEYTDSPFPEDDGKKHPVSFDIEYVHQLQNLYFALQHEELILRNEQSR